MLQSDRIVFPMPRDEVGYDLIPASEYGLFLYRRVANQNLELVKLDTTLNRDLEGLSPIGGRIRAPG